MTALSPRTTALPMPPAANPRLWQKAQQLEASFLGAMLAHTGLDAGQNDPLSASGQPSEFASFLREEQAKAIVADGGIGLTALIYQGLLR